MFIKFIFQLIVTVVVQSTMNSNCKELKGRQKKGVNFEEAMATAFSEIFHNLKEIDADVKKKREKVDLQRRRQSAPADMIRDVTEKREPEKKLGRKLPRRPASSSTLPAMQWPVLKCYEEEEDVVFKSVDSSLGFLDRQDNQQAVKD